MPNIGITADEVRDSLDYDPETGVFKWKRMARKRGARAGHLHYTGYVRIKMGTKSYAAHRLAWLYMTGEWPINDVDHINLDRSDNRWSNLRGATRSQNKANMGCHRRTASGLKGAHRNRKKNKWQSVITANGVRRYLGYFDTAEEAHNAYRIAAQTYCGEFARSK